jgi:hypothetical protein
MAQPGTTVLTMIINFTLLPCLQARKKSRRCYANIWI